MVLNPTSVLESLGIMGRIGKNRLRPKIEERDGLIISTRPISVRRDERKDKIGFIVILWAIDRIGGYRVLPTKPVHSRLFRYLDSFGTAGSDSSPSLFLVYNKLMNDSVSACIRSYLTARQRKNDWGLGFIDIRLPVGEEEDRVIDAMFGRLSVRENAILAQAYDQLRVMPDRFTIGRVEPWVARDLVLFYPAVDRIEVGKESKSGW